MSQLFFRKVQSSIRTALDSGNIEVASFLTEVNDWVMQGRFTQYYQADSFLALLGQPDSLVAQRLGVKETTVRVTRRKLSREILSLLGEDFFLEIEQKGAAGLGEARRRFEFAQSPRSSNNLIPPNVLKCVGDNVQAEELSHSKVEYALSECMEEVLFLVESAKPVLEAQAGNLNTDKLRYLLSMLDGEAGDRGDRVKLVGAINNKVEAEIIKGLEKH